MCEPIQGTKIVNICTDPAYQRVWFKAKKRTCQISNFPLVLQPKPLYRATGCMKLFVPIAIYSYSTISTHSDNTCFQYSE